MASVTTAFQIKRVSPSVEEFLSLRIKVGWKNPVKNIASASLQNSLFHVVAYDKSRLVAMGRVIGDGAMYFYIQDVVVAPDYQGVGLGAALMDEIEFYLASAAHEGATIGLLAAKGKEAFYARYAYLARPSASLGQGMCKFV